MLMRSKHKINIKYLLPYTAFYLNRLIVKIIEKLKVLFMNMSYQSCHTLFEEISPLLNQTSYKFLNFFDKNKIENRTENISGKFVSIINFIIKN